MRVALITDALGLPPRGNATTVRRWLELCPGELRAYPPDPDQPFDPVPDLFHGYHAWRGGRAARTLAARYDRPYIVSLGGTDLYEVRSRGPQADEIATVLRDAALVTGAFSTFAGSTPFAEVPRSIEIPVDATPKRDKGRVRALLPAGLRPVKDIELALRIGKTLVDAGLPFTLRVLGPALDEAYAARVRAQARQYPWLRLEELPRDGMNSAYAEAHVVWNTSLFEGGANALLEGAAAGCALFARDVPGNRELLSEPGAPGVLFDPEDGALALRFHQERLQEDPTARFERTLRWIRERHAPELEAAALGQAWSRALQEGRPKKST